MQGPKNVLFVCTGNTCRSVIAEKLFVKIAAELEVEARARSCGVAAERCFQVPAGARKALKSHGIGEFAHTPQLVSRELLRWADVVLAMSREQGDQVADQFPEHARKIHLLRAYAGLSPAEIEDPIGRSDEAYAECARLIQEALRKLLAS